MKAIFVLLAICISASQGANYYWRDFNGTVPNDAVIPADNVFIGQTPFAENLDPLPGTFYPGTNTFLTMASNVKIKVTENHKFKILCTTEPDLFYWEYVNIKELTGNKLNNLVVGGFEIKEKLYIGKMMHEGQWKIGKVFPAGTKYEGLNVWTDSGSNYTAKDFQILAYYD